VVDRKLFKVKVLPSSKGQSVRALGDDSLVVEVKSPPSEGRANSECLEVLARFLGCDTRALRILRGGRSPHKIIEWIKER
jgi:hypothetical protein